MSISPNGKKLIFVLVTLLCLAFAALYTLFSARSVPRATESAASAPKWQSPVVSPPVLEESAAPQAAQKPPAPPTKQPQTPTHSRPRLVALNMRDSSNLGTVEYAPLDDVDQQRTATDLRCERVYFAAHKGICLGREIHMFNARTIATVVDANFQPQSTIRTDGIPSRARIASDGRYAAFTVFLTGHSYGDAQMSTATLLLDVGRGTTIANLEEFQVWQDGKVARAPDFNFWGVTFQRDSNFFYATLRTGGINYLVHGDIKARTMTVIYKGVECPALSPDGKRIAFKKLVSRNNWRLTVLDIATLQETPLAETKSVDDQAEWLDNHHVLYALVDSAPWMSIMVVPSDGTGQPQIFAKGATSPAVAR
jgi:WD40 repeat protein